MAWSSSERRKRRKGCSNPKGFTMRQFCRNQRTRSGKGERANESLLRQLIREELSVDDIAIATLGNTSTGPVYVIAYKLHDLESNAQDVRGGGSGEYDHNNGVVAGVVLRKDNEFGECNGSWRVVSSASGEKGWGSRVYLAALDFLRNISSDRFSVTDAAEGTWKKLARYGFVEREEFDNIRNPKTPPTSDDCRVFPARDIVLNSSWRLTGQIPSDVKGLIDAGDYHFRELGRDGLRQEAENLLKTGFDRLFVRMYS